MPRPYERTPISTYSFNGSSAIQRRCSFKMLPSFTRGQRSLILRIHLACHTCPQNTSLQSHLGGRGEQLLDFIHDLQDAFLLLDDAFDELLRWQVIEVFLGVRVFDVEIAAVTKDRRRRHLPSALVLL